MSKRFIPAPAGNTPHLGANALRLPVHPRACGEHRRSNGDASAQCGSSPRLRGTLVSMALRPPGVRFIPAPAGNTMLWQTETISKTVHPRACGEH